MDRQGHRVRHPVELSLADVHLLTLRPEETLDCFLRTDMDLLVLGPWVVRKEGAGRAPAGGSGAKARMRGSVERTGELVER